MIRLNRRTLSPLHCASKDPTRYNINGLHFSKEGVTVGTNAHILACVRPAEFEPHPQSFSLEPAALAAAVKATRPVRAPDVEVAEGLAPRRWLVGDLEHSEMDVDYPNWRQVHPIKHAIPQHTLALSLHVLEALVATARQFAGGKKGDERTYLTFELPSDPIKPVRVHTADPGSGDVLELSLMPRRL